VASSQALIDYSDLADCGNSATASAAELLASNIGGTQGYVSQPLLSRDLSFQRLLAMSFNDALFRVILVPFYFKCTLLT